MTMDTTSVKAWAICIAVLTAIQLLPDPQSSTHVEFSIVNLTVVALMSTLCFITLRFFAGTTRESQKPPYKVQPMGIWSYVWRFFVAYMVATLIATFSIAAIVAYTGLVIPLVFLLVHFLVFALFCFTCFCPDRKASLGKLKSLLTPKSA